MVKGVTEMNETWSGFLWFNKCGRRRLVPFLSVLLFCVMGAQPAVAGCFRFHNAGDRVFDVAVRAGDLAICPNIQCWQADIPPGVTQEYCPGPIVLPLPPPPGMSGPENLLFITINRMTAAEIYLSGLRRNFTCDITIRHPANWSNSWEAVGCEATRIR